MMNCHYINTQLERIQQAKVGAGERLSIGGSSGLEEQLRVIELAIEHPRRDVEAKGPVPLGVKASSSSDQEKFHRATLTGSRAQN